MNIRKGFLRLTFIVSILVGIATMFLNGLFPRHSITVEIPKYLQIKGESKKIDYLESSTDFRQLPKIVQLNIKNQFIGAIEEIERIPEIRKDDEFRNKTLEMKITFMPGRRELGLLAFIGFVSVWLLYAFIRWVVIGFIIDGFRCKGFSQNHSQIDNKPKLD